MRHTPFPVSALILCVSLATSARAEQPEESFSDEEVSGSEPQNDGAETPAPPPTTDKTESIDTLHKEYVKLRDRLFQSQARASAVASALYSTKLTVQLQYDSARYYTVTRTTIRLDGANIYDNSDGSISKDRATRFDGFIAPGKHQLGIRIEATGKDDDRFATVLDNSFIIQAPKGRNLIVKATAQDNGDIAYRWSKDSKGSYQLHLNIAVTSHKPKTTNTVKRKDS